MFRRKSDTSKKSTSKTLSQYGLFDIPDDLDKIGVSDGSEDDSDLEAELAALSAQDRPKPKNKPKVVVAPEHLAAMVAESMKDIPSDEELSDTDDPDILNELENLTMKEEESVSSDAPPRPSRAAPPLPSGPPSDTVTLLQERLNMYVLAEQTANNAGETSRARRFNRGFKTLQDLLKQAKSGKLINEEDIPPIVAISHTPKPAADHGQSAESEIRTKPIPQSPTDAGPSSQVNPDEDDSVKLSDEEQLKLRMLIEHRDEYKAAALRSKKEGDGATALSYIKTVKQFEQVIKAVRAGQPVDLTNMPPPPGSTQPPPPQPKQEDVHQGSTDAPPELGEPGVVSGETGSLITASSVDEALKQRLDIYKQQQAAATEQQNSSKSRRMGRIVKQYEQAIKLHSAGKPIPFEDLPTPPGYAPIPGSEPKAEPTQPKPDSAPSIPQNPQEGIASSSISPASPSRANSVRKLGNQKGTGHVERQIQILLLRQNEFKEAALNSKKNGEISEAKEYLRSAKGLDPLIEAARGGFPIDLASVPLPPQAKQQLEDTFDLVSADDCTISDDGVNDLLQRLEEQLTSQLKLCLNTRDHLKALGDIAGINRFEHLALNVKQDLDVVKLAKRSGSEPPKFHYETKEFSVVQSCTDLNDNDLELTIVRGLSYGVSNPKDIDTYVKFEFPFPQEQPYSDRTPLVKDTNSPEYNSVFILPINRTARPCLRVFKRHGIKFEIYSRGCCGQPCSCHHLLCFSGFFVRDTLIGTTTVKLQPLESQTVLHDSFELMDGRKKVGGQLEIKLRVRHPLLAKQIEHTKQKWLIIDH